MINSVFIVLIQLISFCIIIVPNYTHFLACILSQGLLFCLDATFYKKIDKREFETDRSLDKRHLIIQKVFFYFLQA